LGASGSAGYKSGSAGDKSGCTGNMSGSTLKAVRENPLLWEWCRCAWSAAGVPGLLQARLECCRCAWNAAGVPRMLQVRLESGRCARKS